MTEIVQAIIMTILVLIAYIVGWNKGQKNTLDDLFLNKKIDVETYLKLKNK